METKMISMYSNGVEHRENPTIQAKKNLERDVIVIREELRMLMDSTSVGFDGGSYKDYLGTKKNDGVIQEATELLTQGGEATAKFVDKTMFHHLVDIYDATGGDYETIVGIQTSDVGEVTSVNELDAERSHGSVSYKAEDLASTQAVAHNHPTESKKKGEIVLQGFSEQDKLTNQRTAEKITETQGTDAAKKYTHFLGKEYIINGKSYQTVVASSLDNSDNMKREKLIIGDKMYYQAIRCPDGQIRDVMDLPERVAAQILYERLMAVDNSNDDFINMVV